MRVRGEVWFVFNVIFSSGYILYSFSSTSYSGKVFWKGLPHGDVTLKPVLLGRE